MMHANASDILNRRMSPEKTDSCPMLAAKIQDNARILVSETPLPSVPVGGARIQVLGCGICGSDLDKLVHQKASPGSVLGHEMVGLIESLDTGASGPWQVGDRLVSAHHVPCLSCHYCLNDSQSMCRQFKSTNFMPGGFAQYLSLSAEHLKHTAFQVPPHISNAEASCVEPLACTLRAIERGFSGSPLHMGSVALIGLGFIGMMAAQVYKNQGHQVFGIDLSPERLDFSQQKGFVDQAFHPLQDATRLQATLQKETPLGRVDTVFLTAVNPATLQLALDLVRDGGNLVLFTSGGNGVSLDPNQLYFREINVITSYSPSLTSLKQAAEMIFRQSIDVQSLTSHEYPLSEVEKAFSVYRSGQALKVFLRMDTP